VETTDNQEVEFDGSIEGALASIIEPEEEFDGEDDLPEEDSDESDTDDGPDYSDEDESDEETDSSEDDEDTENAVQEGQKFTVKVDGQEVAVTLDELKQGYSGQKYVPKGHARSRNAA
jgi:hypothetical protein